MQPTSGRRRQGYTVAIRPAPRCSRRGPLPRRTAALRTCGLQLGVAPLVPRLRTPVRSARGTAPTARTVWRRRCGWGSFSARVAVTGQPRPTLTADSVAFGMPVRIGGIKRAEFAPSYRLRPSQSVEPLPHIEELTEQGYPSEYGPQGKQSDSDGDPQGHQRGQDASTGEHGPHHDS